MSSLTTAVAAVITDASGRVLLCQQSQGHRLWTLPGGKIRNSESPTRALVRDVMEETGGTTEVVDLVGIYQLTGNGCGDDLPDVLVHVFRGRMDRADLTVNAPGRIRRLSWHDPAFLPQPIGATAAIAIADAAAGRSGVLRHVERVAGPEIPDASEAEPSIPPQHPLSALTTVSTGRS
jgi:ADP-ribose pyrophosphatase YjhB (NUDIX family)